MRWIVVTPFSKGRGEDWIPQHVEGFAFDVVPSAYDHDRSRPKASLSDWWDYFRHAYAAYRLSRAAPRDVVGVLTCFPQLALAMALLKRVFRSDLRIVAWCFNLNRPYRGWKGVLARAALGNIDLFVVHSRKEVEVYAAWLRLPPERFRFANLSIKEAAPSTPEADGTPFVVAMGTANRDYDTLIRALAGTDARAKIVAGAWMAARLPRAPNVEVLSNLDLPACHRLSQEAVVNVVPLDGAMSPSGQVTVLEAMMFGRCVVATACAGTVDYIEHGVNGFLVPPHDAGALGTLIADLMRDKPRRDAVGREARRSVLAHNTFRAVAREMTAVCEEALRAPRRR